MDIGFAGAGWSAEGCRIETARPRDLSGDALEAWRALAGRALEPNPFMEPDYVLAAAQHMPEGRHVALILVWRGGRLRAVLPMLSPSLAWRRRSAQVWDIPLAAGGAPLLDPEAPAAALRAALAFLARSGARVLALPGLPARGAVAGLVARDPSFAGAVWTLRRGAPALRPAGQGGTGRVRDAVETFLALDAARAERREGECLLQDPAAVTFVRAVTRRFAARGACRIDVTERDGRPADATIVLGTPGAERRWLAASGPRSLAPDRLDAVLPLQDAAARAA